MMNKVEAINKILQDNIPDVKFFIIDNSYGTQEELLVSWCEGPLITEVNQYYRDKFENVYCKRLLSYGNATKFKDYLEEKYDAHGNIVIKDFFDKNVGYVIGMNRKSPLYNTRKGREIRAEIWAKTHCSKPFDKK